MPRRAPQRTRNRTTVYPSTPIITPTLPVLASRVNSEGDLILTFGGPVSVTGIPPLVIIGNDPPSAASAISETEVYFDFPAPVVPSAIVHIPDRAPEWRGLAGEWIPAADFAASAGQLGTLPPLVFITRVYIALGVGVVATLNDSMSGTELLDLYIAGSTRTGGYQSSPTEWTLTFDPEPTAGALWEIGAWSSGGVDGSPWVAPGRGVVENE